MAIKNANTIVENSATGQPQPVSVPGSAQNGTEAASTLKPGSQSAMPRQELMAQAVAVMGGMDSGDLSKFLEGLSMNTGAAQSKSLGGDQSKNRASIEPKGDAKSAMKEDVVAMFVGQDLSEETLEKAVTLFEAAIHLRTELENSRLADEYEVKLSEAVTEVTETVEGRVDEYLNYVVEQWMEQNAVAVDSQIKTDIAMNFMDGLKTLFTDNFIEIPDDKVDVVEELTTENLALETKLNEVMVEVVALKAAQAKTVQPEIVAEMEIGLSDLQKTTFKTLVESVDANLPPEDYRAKLKVLREHYFKTGKPTGVILNETVSKTVEEIAAETKVVSAAPEEELSEEMKSYVGAISRTNQ
jgi:hypothetical protein